MSPGGREAVARGGRGGGGRKKGSIRVADERRGGEEAARGKAWRLSTDHRSQVVSRQSCSCPLRAHSVHSGVSHLHSDQKQSCDLFCFPATRDAHHHQRNSGEQGIQRERAEFCIMAPLFLLSPASRVSGSRTGMCPRLLLSMSMLISHFCQRLPLHAI